MNLLIRADASVEIGTGHVMRCLALAQAWQDAGGQAVFAMAESTAAIQARLAAESCHLVAVQCEPGSPDDARQTVAVGRQCQAEWVVMDGYRFTAEYQQALKDAGFKVLCFDDNGQAGHYYADFVLNQNVYAKEEMYVARGANTRLLLGPQYCMLRREFRAWRGWKRAIATIGRKVLVTMGGSDPENLTELVVAALHQLPGIEAVVVVGGSFPRDSAFGEAASDNNGWMRIEKNVLNMPELMAWADVAVAGAGTTCGEMCRLQLPMAVIDVAENQRPIARALGSLGAAIHLGTAKTVTEGEIAIQVARLLESSTERAKLAECCGRLVDGWGTDRLLRELARD